MFISLICFITHQFCSYFSAIIYNHFLSLCALSFRLNLRGNSEVYSSGLCLDEECWRSYEQKVHALLHQGLGDRAKSIRVTWRNASPESNVENVCNWWSEFLCLCLSTHAHTCFVSYQRYLVIWTKYSDYLIIIGIINI